MQILLTNNRADNNVPKNKQAVTETFDKPYKSQWETSDYDDVDVLAKSPDGTNISINFHNFGGDYWHVEFHRNHGQAVTGEGDAQRIFATVLQTIQKFVKKYKPRILEFAASKDVEPGQSSQSRAKLYDRLVQRYARAWGYDLWREDNDDHVVYKFSPLEDVTENFADGLISGKEMLDIFKRMHHEHGYNKQMERWIAKQTWSLDTIEPEQLQDMYNDDEDADPFDRTVWLDDAAVTKYERILSAGHLVNPIIMGLDRTVIDGNHRAQAAKNLHVSIPGYVPVKNDVTENFAADVMSTDDMIAYISAHDGRTLHQDFLDDLNTFSQFVLKTIPLDTIWTELPMLDRAKVEKYKQMDFSKAPPIVIGDGYILDGYHRATVAKALGIKSIKAYVGVKGVTENFADGKGPGRPGDSRRHGIPKHATLTQLDKIAHQGGRKGQLAHWQANMRRGRAKVNENELGSYMPLDIAQLKELLSIVQDLQEDVDNHSFDVKPGTVAYKQIEQEYRALTAIEYVIENNIKAINNSELQPGAIFVYDWEYDDAIGAAQLHVTGTVAELKWLGSYNSSGKQLMQQGLAHAKAMGAKTVNLTSKWGSAEYYRKQGFTPVDDVTDNPITDVGASFKKDIEEAIAPHGDSWNELNLMKIGQKPVALVGPYEFENLYKPVMRKYNWIWTQVNISNPNPEILVLGFDRYIIGQPGEQARIARMHQLLVQMNKNLSNDIRPDADYHIEMGRLLGYSDADIAEFLKKINL